MSTVHSFVVISSQFKLCPYSIYHVWCLNCILHIVGKGFVVVGGGGGVLIVCFGAPEHVHKELRTLKLSIKLFLSDKTHVNLSWIPLNTGNNVTCA